MASIQTSFSVMPAWSTGSAAPSSAARSRSRRSSRSPRCRRGSSSRRLAARRRPRHPDLARALRPDLRVPRHARRHRRAGESVEVAAAGDVVYDRVWFRYGENRLDAAGRELRRPRRDDDRARRRDRRREDDPRLSRGAALRRRPGLRLDRRRRRPGPQLRRAGDLVGVVSQETYLFHASVRENLRFAKPERRTRSSTRPPRRRGSTT
jgi:ABC-type bacteriocin/lantibiotic exporters, contain an N-terminal double-glycine peptidase domain